MRVAIAVYGGEGWLGGRNYIRNLLTAVYQLHDRKIEPVLFTTPTSDDQLAGLPPFETVRSNLFTSRPFTRYVQRGLTAVLNRNWAVEQLLRRHGISVLSHSGHLGANSSVPTIGWIPDFQSLHLPAFETEKERKRRDGKLQRMCANCTKIVVSSQCVRADFESFAPHYARKAEILRFVAAPLPKSETTPIETLRRKHGITGDYFLLPNQFWAHKNHRTVISALKILRDRGVPATVVATGATADHRDPGFFNSLIQYAEECGVRGDFKTLGIVPYSDLAGLMANAIALINPSLFEGWSTSVEESKSAGKMIVLSDIPVHREQNPTRGLYFPPLDPESLADALLNARSQFDLAQDLANQQQAGEEFPARQAEFARTYQRIVLSSASESSVR